MPLVKSYPGVYPHVESNDEYVWRARALRLDDGKYRYLGTFSSEHEAGRAVYNDCVRHGIEWPGKAVPPGTPNSNGMPDNENAPRAVRVEQSGPRPSLTFPGVCQNARTGRWHASAISAAGCALSPSVYLGNFDTEDAAAVAVHSDCLSRGTPWDGKVPVYTRCVESDAKKSPTLNEDDSRGARENRRLEPGEPSTVTSCQTAEERALHHQKFVDKVLWERSSVSTLTSESDISAVQAVVAENTFLRDTVDKMCAKSVQVAEDMRTLMEAQVNQELSALRKRISSLENENSRLRAKLPLFSKESESDQRNSPESEGSAEISQEPTRKRPKRSNRTVRQISVSP